MRHLPNSLVIGPTKTQSCVGTFGLSPILSPKRHVCGFDRVLGQNDMAGLLEILEESIT